MNGNMKFLAIILGIAGIAGMQVLHHFFQDIDPTLVIVAIGSGLGGLGVHITQNPSNQSNEVPK